MTQRTWLFLLMTALLLLCLAACSSNEGTTPETTDATPETVDEAPAPEEVDEPQVEPVTEEPEAETEAEPAVVSDIDDVASLAPEGAFSDAATALDALESYRYSTLFTFVGEEGGEIEAGSIELMGTVAGPDEKHLIWMDLESEERFEVIQLGNRAWVFSEDEWEEAPVMVAETMSQAVLIYAPSIAWGGIFGGLEPTATYVGRETVNGVSAHHYTSTYEQWGGYWAGALENASGDVWIAEAGYPVKYRFAATGVDEDGNLGEVTWRMDLADVNTEITIDPPLPIEVEAQEEPEERRPRQETRTPTSRPITMRDLEGTFSATANDVTMTLVIFDADADTAYAMLSSTNAGTSTCVAALLGDTILLAFEDLSEMRLRVDGTDRLTFVESGVTLRRR